MKGRNGGDYTNEYNFWHQRTMTFTTGPSTTSTTLTLQFPLHPDPNNPVNDGYIAIDDIKINCVETATSIAINNTNTFSTDKNLNESQIAIYPNPTKEHLNIELLDTSNQIEAIEIFNIQGHRVWKSETIENAKINIASLKKGIYFINIKTSKEGLIIKKIIKQ